MLCTTLALCGWTNMLFTVPGAVTKDTANSHLGMLTQGIFLHCSCSGCGDNSTFRTRFSQTANPQDSGKLRPCVNLYMATVKKPCCPQICYCTWCAGGQSMHRREIFIYRLVQQCGFGGRSTKPAPRLIELFTVYTF